MQAVQRDGTGSPAAAYGLMAGGMALYGTATPISALVGDSFPAILGSALRMATAALVLLPLFVIQQWRQQGGVVPALARRDWLLLLGIAAVGTFGFSLLLLFGMRIVPGAVGAIVMALTPAVTAMGAVAFLGDEVDRWKVSGLAMAVTGVVAVNLGGGAHGGGGAGGPLWLGTLLVFGAVCCEASYSLMGKRLTANLSPLGIAALASALAGVLFAPLAAVQGGGFDWTQPAWTDWLAVVFWGAGTLGLGSVLWFRGMMRVQATTASGFMAVMPVSALVGSYVLLGESFHPIHAVGLLAVLAGIWAVTRSGAHVH